MGGFKVKSELIPVTAGDSHSGKNETLGFELCRRVLAEPFKFHWEGGGTWGEHVSWEFVFFNIYKNVKLKTVVNFCSLFQSK